MGILHISARGLKGHTLDCQFILEDQMPKCKTFQYIKEKVWNKIQGLQKNGYHTIKAAALALPV